MADLLEKLWPAFVSEVTEQLDSVELLLAKSSTPANIDVNHLFRNFHTIKGNCSMIGFTSMETIAHRSEDILAVVRNGEMAMSEAVVDILLEAISCLKKQFQAANDSRENPSQDDALVERLTSFVSVNGEAEEEQSVSDEERQSLLNELSMSAKMAVPVLVLGLDPAAKIEAVETAIAAMAQKASACGFRGLSGALSHFVDTLKTDIDDKATHLLEQVAEIFDDIDFISNENNIDLGLDTGAKLCRSKLTPAYKAELEQLQSVYNDLHSLDQSEWQVDQFMAVVGFTTKLANYCSLFKLTELHASWRYIRQLVIEVSRGYLLFNKAIIEKMQEIVESAGSPEALAGGDDAFEALCKANRETLQTITAKHNNSSDEIVSLKEEITSKTTLCFDSLVDLKIDALTSINNAIEEGKLAVEIDIDFADEELSEKVLKTVTNLGELAHSRTMFHDIVNGVAQRTSFAFLILAQKTFEEVDQILSIIDKERKTYTILGFQDEEVTTDSATELDEPSAVVEDTGSEKQNEAAQELDELEETESLVSETSMSMGSLKVDGSAIDRVIRDVGELITHHNRLSHLIMHEDFTLNLSQLKAIVDSSRDEQTKSLMDFFDSLYTQLNTTNENLQTSLNQIQESVLDLRVVPISYVFNRFHKFVRTIGQKLNKKVILDVIGEQVKVDKGMIDVLAEPLAHMVRNSIDHGIETPEERKSKGKEEFGLIKLKAVQHSGMVVIEISDDGAGLNKEKILNKCIDKGMLSKGVEYSDHDIFKNVFEPGFSTSDVISETSGRGVGMDVVKSKIVEVGGTVNIDSTLGVGTTITLKLPISAAIQSVILVENDQQTLALPERFVDEVISVSAKDVQVVQEQSAIMLRDNIVPLYSLNDLISTASGAQQSFTEQDEFEVVVLADDQYTVGLVVDAALGRTEVLVRDVHDTLRHMSGVSGAAVLGDGKVVIILDCGGLFELALSNAQNIVGMSAVNA